MTSGMKSLLKNKKVMIVLVVVLLGGAFAAKTFLLAPPPVDEAKLSKEPGPVYTMVDPFVVNLADTGTPHFAKVGLAIRLSKFSEHKLPVVKGDVPPRIEDDAEVRDIVISTLSGKTSNELETVAGRNAVKKEIMTAINHETELRIVDVYYTEFAVQ
jgi:flagellar FliL protein